MGKVMGRLRNNKVFVNRRAHGLAPAPKGYVWDNQKMGVDGLKGELEGVIIDPSSGRGSARQKPALLFRPSAKYKKRFMRA